MAGEQTSQLHVKVRLISELIVLKSSCKGFTLHPPASPVRPEPYYRAYFQGLGFRVQVVSRVSKLGYRDDDKGFGGDAM